MLLRSLRWLGSMRWLAKRKGATSSRRLRRLTFRPHVEQLETRLAPAAITTLASFGGAAAANTTYVNNLYELLLHRPGEPGGASYWMNLLNSGIAPASVVQGIEGSTEYHNDQVNAHFLRYLGRTADLGGLQVWSGLLAGGGSIEQVIQGLVSSPEYFALHGSDNSTFVSALYRDILNRTASAGEVQGWLTALESGASRAQVAWGFLTSREYDTDLVDSYYTDFLGRPADSGGQVAWVQALQAGMSDSAVLAAFLGSPEGHSDYCESNVVGITVTGGPAPRPGMPPPATHYYLLSRETASRLEHYIMVNNGLPGGYGLMSFTGPGGTEYSAGIPFDLNSSFPQLTAFPVASPPAGSTVISMTSFIL